MDVSPASLAIRSSSSDSRPPIPRPRWPSLTWRYASWAKRRPEVGPTTPDADEAVTVERPESTRPPAT